MRAQCCCIHFTPPIDLYWWLARHPLAWLGCAIMGGSAHLNYAAGGVLIAGGLAGYVRAGSIASLAGGGTLGGAMCVAGMMISKGRDLEGHALALSASTVLLATMGQRFFRTGKFMPAGAAASVGALTALYNGKKTVDWM